MLGLLVLGLLALTLAVLAKGPDAVPDGVLPQEEPTAAEEQLLAYAEVQAAAREWTTDFLRVDHESMDPLVERVLAGTTDPFRKEYAASEEKLKSQARANESQATGKVLEVGVNELDGDRATLFVAADSEVSNKHTAKSQQRYYRIELTMVREGDRWLTSDLTFVG